MRSTIIKTVIAISVSVALFPQLASAITTSFSCSSNLVVSLDNGYSASCDGDFSFTDGVLQNDTSISLTAGGFLNIGSNASLIAPKISLFSTNIIVNTGATIDSGYRGNIAGSSEPINVFPQRPKLNISEFNILDLEGSATVVFKAGNSINLTASTPVNIAELNQIGGTLVLQNTGGIVLSGSGISASSFNDTSYDDVVFYDDFVVGEVPEPSTYVMMMLGLIPLGFMSKRKASQQIT